MLSRTFFRRFLAPEISVLRVALSAVLVYAAVAAWAWFISDRMMFLPPAPSYRDTPDVLRLPTADGERIAAVYFPNPAATYTLLLSHGNAEQGVRSAAFHSEGDRFAGIRIRRFDNRVNVGIPPVHFLHLAGEGNGLGGIELRRY